MGNYLYGLDRTGHMSCLDVKENICMREVIDRYIYIYIYDLI